MVKRWFARWTEVEEQHAKVVVVRLAKRWKWNIVFCRAQSIGREREKRSRDMTKFERAIAHGKHLGMKRKAKRCPFNGIHATQEMTKQFIFVSPTFRKILELFTKFKFMMWQRLFNNVLQNVNPVSLSCSFICCYECAWGMCEKENMQKMKVVVVTFYCCYKFNFVISFVFILYFHDFTGSMTRDVPLPFLIINFFWRRTSKDFVFFLFNCGR